MRRRQFLITTGAACLSGCKRTSRRKPDKTQQPPPVATGVAGRGQVFEAQHNHALDSRGQPAAQPVQDLLDHLMRELTGRTQILDAWASLFRPGDVVGIKPNARGGNYCSPSPALLGAVIKRLTEVGVQPGNILIWELKHFTETDLHAYLKQGPAVMKIQDDWGLHPQTFRLPSGARARFNNAVHRATAIINIATFKDHGLAGVTGALKNLTMGSIDHPRDHHPNGCNPAVPELYNLPILRNKVRLTLADAFRMIYNRGPTGPRSVSWNIPFNRLYATRDPVALDRVQWDEIDRKRQAHGMIPLMKIARGKDKVGRPIHVLHAATLGLGEADLSKIRVGRKSFG